MIRQGSGEPLMLLHGVGCSERVWKEVAPLLAADHDVIAPTALGHRGGPSPTISPIRFHHIVDDAERLLDELGFDTVHLAGNSMGGWIAIELARRGRAKTVCALSPAGMWEHDGEDMRRVFGILASLARDTRRGRPVVPLLARSKRFRRWAARYSVTNGERISRADFIELADDLIGIGDLLESAESLAPLESSPCPITVAWSGGDRLFPIDHYGPRARSLVPEADFVVLDNVGHVPMLDDPALVARTILASTARSSKTTPSRS